MRNRLIFSLFCFLGLFPAFSQVVTTDPIFPIDDQQVTITFDAAEGNKELKDCNCVVYAHTGVITDKSTSGSDWKYVQSVWATDDAPRKMVNIGNNKYTLSYNIRSFYGVPAADKILKMAFVFRNLNGSKVGRSTTGSDIFVDVYGSNAGLQTLLSFPSVTNITTTSGQIIPIKFSASKLATLELWVNGNKVTSKNNASQLDYNYTTGGPGDYAVELRATSGAEVSSKFFNIVVPKANNLQPLPSGSVLGANRVGNGIRLVIEAPTKNNAFLIGNFTNWRPSINFQMNKTPEGKYFWIDYVPSQPNEILLYQYIVDGITIADPLSELILDPQNDKKIENDVFPNLPPYPPSTNGHVSVVYVGAQPYPWKVTNFTPPAKEDLVLYELLVRDFVKKHDYKTIEDTLDYLKRLGVNAIELMPVNEFENNESWGYNVSYHMALDKYYGSPERFKSLIDEAHKRGMAIILDVVFNHVFGQSPLCALYWDAAGNKPSPFSPWLNPDAKHPYNVGYDFDHESKSTKDYVKRCLNYWLTEYKVDGFRFDLSKGFTQTQSTESTMGNYDASRIAILKGYADAIWSTNPNAHVILEHFAENKEEVELANYGMMLWGNMNYAYNEATMGYPSNLTGILYSNRGWTKPHLVGYMESHDEERLMFKNLQYGNSAGGYSVKTLATALERNAMASVFFYAIPGPKMIWQFGEMGYDHSIFTCSDGTVKLTDTGCKLSNKPIRWDYQSDPLRRKLYNITADMAFLKQTQPVFKTTAINAQLANKTKSIVLTAPSMNVVAIGNFDVANGSIAVTFPSTGWYYDYLGKDSVNISSTTQTINLNPGEYHLYLSKKLSRPSVSFPTSSKDLTLNDLVEMSIFPNPTSASSEATLLIDAPANIDYLNLKILDLNGQLVREVVNQGNQGNYALVSLPTLKQGFYVVVCQTNFGTKTMKWVVAE